MSNCTRYQLYYLPDTTLCNLIHTEPMWIPTYPTTSTIYTHEPGDCPLNLVYSMHKPHFYRFRRPFSCFRHVKKFNMKKSFFVVFYTTLFMVTNTNIMLLYSCFIVILLFSSILQLVELFGTRKQNFEDDVLTGNSVSNPKFRFVYRFSGEHGKSLALG